MVDVGSTPVIQTGGCDAMGGGNWMWAFLLFAILGRGNGFGFGEGGGYPTAMIEKSIYNSSMLGQLDNGIRAIQNGFCDSTFALNNSVKDGFFRNASEIQGVNTNIGNAICSQTYELANQIRNVSEKISSCCCDTQRSIDGVNLNIERNTNALMKSNEESTARILAWLQNKELSDKNEKIFEMSQRAQTVEIIAAQKPVTPVPAYLQPSPYAPYYPYGFNGFNGYGGFGGCGNTCHSF